MSRNLRKSIGLMAIFALALHAILFGVPMQAAADAVDPFTIICHSGPVDPAAANPAPSGQPPSKACDHCSLCFVAAGLSGPNTALFGRFAPPALLHVLLPASSAARPHLAASPHLPRGPPQAV